MALKAGADNNRVANRVGDTGRLVFSGRESCRIQALYKLHNDIFQLSNIVSATVYSWTVGSAHFSVPKLTIRRGGVHIAYQQTLWRCVAEAGLGR
jgi:hypothetical protein